MASILPVIAHDFRLLLIRNGDIEIDKNGFSFPHLAVNDVVLIGRFIEIGDQSYLVSHAEAVLFQVFIHVADDGRRDVFAEKFQRFLALLSDLIAGAVPHRFLFYQTCIQKLVQGLLECEIRGVLTIQEKIGELRVGQRKIDLVQHIEIHQFVKCHRFSQHGKTPLLLFRNGVNFVRFLR